MGSLDHVVLAVPDLDAAGARMRTAYGLGSVEGGVHPRWGTGNRIVPLGDGYLELLAVVDPAVAEASAVGRAIAAAVADGQERWFAWCVAADDLDRTAGRLGLAIEPGTRTTPDGRTIAWRGAGLDDRRRRPELPFFIEWLVPPSDRPARTAVEHDVRIDGIVAVEVAGDAETLDGWLGPDRDGLPLRLTEGRPGVRALEVARADGSPTKVEAG
jgi:hypothetical protein